MIEEQVLCTVGNVLFEKPATGLLRKKESVLYLAPHIGSAEEELEAYQNIMALAQSCPHIDFYI